MPASKPTRVSTRFAPAATCSAIAVAAVLTPAGCTPQRVKPAGDPSLADQNVALEDQVAQLRQTLSAREEELAARDAAQRQGDPPVEGEGGGPALELAEVRLHRWSGLVDSDEDGRYDTLRLDLLPEDRDGRFLPIRATAQIRVAPVLRSLDEPSEGSLIKPAIDLDGQAWHAAYRTGLTGTFYRVEAPLPATGEAQDVTSWAVYVRVVESDTGAVFAVDRLYENKGAGWAAGK